MGEIILRVNDMELMKQFYGTTLGLPMMKVSENYAFFKIADGFGGHHQTLALFSKNNLTAFGEKLQSIKPEHNSLHHFALEIDKMDYEGIRTYLDQRDIPCQTEIFEWVQWKSIFIKDPESNIVEFVCYDAAI